MTLAGAVFVIGAVIAILATGPAHSDSPSPTIPPEKQLAVDSDDNARAEALEHPPSPGATKSEQIVTQTDAPLALGISVSQDAQIPGYTFNTLWRELVNDTYLTVFAGTAKSEPTRGLLLVWMTEPGHGVVGPAEIFKAPPSAGRLSITSAEHHLLHLASTAGQEFLFDADSKTLEYPDGNPVPTDTPIPTYPPDPPPGWTPPFEPETPSITATPTATAAPTFAPPTAAAGG